MRVTHLKINGQVEKVIGANKVVIDFIQKHSLGVLVGDVSDLHRDESVDRNTGMSTRKQSVIFSPQLQRGFSSACSCTHHQIQNHEFKRGQPSDVQRPTQETQNA